MKQPVLDSPCILLIRVYFFVPIMSKRLIYVVSSLVYKKPNINRNIFNMTILATPIPSN